jgi:hypothetical protein
MTTSGKIALSLGVASSALLAAWLFSGNRKAKTREFVAKRAVGLRNVLKSGKMVVDDQSGYYM